MYLYKTLNGKNIYTVLFRRFAFMSTAYGSIDLVVPATSAVFTDG